MSNITKKMTKDEIFKLKERIQHQILEEKKPKYTYFQVKLRECTITAYESGKVVFQGKDLDWLQDDQPNTTNQDIYPQAGSDEVGTGDYFGPVVVCACIVEQKDVEALKKAGIQDSKQINDEKIRKIAPIIQSLCHYSVLILSNEKYNKVHNEHNMVDIKCKMHNQAYVNLETKGYSVPKFKIIDQFVQESSYYKYLKNEKNIVKNIHFETKAENKYLSVACASVIARNTFLEYWDALEEKYNFHFEKGAGHKVDLCAQRFVDEFGFETLEQVAKLHFANTKKIEN